MSSTIISETANPSTVSKRGGVVIGLFAGRRGRRLRETLLAYAFLTPAFLIVGIFGLFPLLFAAYESTLRGLNKILGTYDGLGNYLRAIDNLTYVLAFWIAAVACYGAVHVVNTALQTSREKGHNPWIWLLPGVLVGSGLALAVVFVFRLLPLLLDIPNQLRGQNATDAQFRKLIFTTWLDGSVQPLFWGAFLLILVGALIAFWIERNSPLRRRVGNYWSAFVNFTILLLGAAGLGWLTWNEVQNAYAAALEAGEGLDLWTQIITISAGFLLLLLAWWLWESASDRQSTLAMASRLVGAAMLLVGAWVLIGELPRVIAAGDKEWWVGLLATVWYSLGTVPTQLLISLVLATLLFQDIKGKAFFRMVYFIPYVAPFVGTAAVFRIIFSSRPTALLNSALGSVGVNPLLWLNDPTGIFQLIVGPNISLPIWAAGPSLALVVIMIYGVWTYIGFNAVIFMAGLGNIPRTVYEAAAIDGAGRWEQFRHVTLPLLSPTIYFLTLLSVIGTFKAFNHIYVLRTAAALGTTDTASVVIFQAFKRDTRFGYASALAILLLLIIVVLTFVNNRIASKRVFYG
ncbi:MAG: sugar ABC transporter permease [Caldilineaceae bacterium]